MNTRTMILRVAGAVLCMAAVGGAMAACSSDDNTATPIVRPDGGGNHDTGAPDGSDNDANNNCESDATTCNSCTTPATDPYNACSDQTANCIPFDDTRVPKDNGNVPQVP